MGAKIYIIMSLILLSMCLLPPRSFVVAKVVRKTYQTNEMLPFLVILLVNTVKGDKNAK